MTDYRRSVNAAAATALSALRAQLQIGWRELAPYEAKAETALQRSIHTASRQPSS
jgi:hypothetical protein